MDESVFTIIETLRFHSYDHLTKSKVKCASDKRLASVSNSMLNLPTRRAMDKSNNIRDMMKEEWSCQEASARGMLLNSRADEFSNDEISEILSYLPSFDGLFVVELGAGIGRFTTHFARKARAVLAVDFVASFIEKNKETNKTLNNIEYKVGDVMDLSMEPNCAGFIFSNWLYMYLNSEEVVSLLQRTLSWLPVNSYMFCRESCHHGSGDKSLPAYPTSYRDPKEYDDIFSSVTIPTEDGEAVYGFTIVKSKPVDTFIKVLGQKYQIIWLLQKERREVNNGHKLPIKNNA